MRLTMRERQHVTETLRRQYRKGGKRGKGKILDLLVETTGYNRAYGAMMLRGRVRGDSGAPPGGRAGGRRPGSGRKKTYDRGDEEALKEIWRTFDWMCGKRLAAAMEELLRVMERHGEWRRGEAVRRRLEGMSPATIDRLLAVEKKRWKLKLRSGTKPGGLLKKQIPIRTYAQWEGGRPGFVEMDLVEHNGGSTGGDYAQTLDMTDVCTGWTETQAVQNKAQVWVFNGIQEVRQRFPFPILGIDSDNGSEFINGHLVRYCQQEKITFTRSRENRKNDNCYVEQKNYSVVRRAAGYGRYETPQEIRCLNELYGVLRLLGNYFLPHMKLVHKERVGSRVCKRYDAPKTAYCRVLESPHVARTVKESLRRQYNQLNPVELKRQIVARQAELRQLAECKQERKKPVRNGKAVG